MAHKTGAAFENGHIIHGAANAMYLGKAIQWNSKDPRAHERYAYVAKEILHLPGTTDDQLIDSLVEKIRSMNDELHIPQSINNYANGGVKADETGEPVMVSEKEFLEKLPTIAANAVQDACTPENPRETKAEDFEKILKCCYYDEPVNF
jgi:alcohol dehydrogenase class IV